MSAILLLQLCGCHDPAQTVRVTTETTASTASSSQGTGTAESTDLKPDPTSSASSSDETQAASTSTTTHTTTVPPPPETSQPSHRHDWLVVSDLQIYEAALNQSAMAQGNVAVYLHPDPGVQQTFLVAAVNLVSAERFNSYFYWFLDLDADPAQQPQLMLCIDRLFSDMTRDAAMADNSYSDPRVVELLEASLRQVLANEYSPEIFNFIVQCYRHDFSDRLSSTQIIRQVWQKAINRIEVTYEADVYTTISFSIISNPA